MALPGGYLLIPRRIVDMPLFMAMNNNRWTEAYHLMTDPAWNEHEVHPATPFTISHTCSGLEGVDHRVLGGTEAVRVGTGEGRTALRIAVFVP